MININSLSFKEFTVGDKRVHRRLQVSFKVSTTSGKHYVPWKKNKNMSVEEASLVEVKIEAGLERLARAIRQQEWTGMMG